MPLLDRFILPLRFGQTNKRGKVYLDIYGMTMQWIIPVFLVIIIIFVSAFAIINPYVQGSYGKNVNQFSVVTTTITEADSNSSSTTLVEAGDYLIPISARVYYKNTDNKEENETVNYTLVFYKDATTRTTTLKVKNTIVERTTFIKQDRVEQKIGGVLCVK